MSAAETVGRIADASTWDERVARIRQVPQRHGTDEHAAIYAAVARQVYVPHLAPDFAYVHHSDFYELPLFETTYERASLATSAFTDVSPERLASVLQTDPTTLLVFRTITGLTKTEFAASTALVAEPLGLASLSAQKVDSMERNGSVTTSAHARIAARTIDQIMRGSLFGEPPGGLKSKQQKPDTADGWASVQEFAAKRVPYSLLLHHDITVGRSVRCSTQHRRCEAI